MGDLSFLGEQAAGEPIECNGSEHQVVSFAVESWTSPVPGRNEPTHPEVAFCVGSGLLQWVRLRPSRWPSRGRRHRRGDPQQRSQSRRAVVGGGSPERTRQGGRGVCGVVGKCWLASLTR